MTILTSTVEPAGTGERMLPLTGLPSTVMALTPAFYRKAAARSGLLLFLYGLYTPACCFANQKTPLSCCARSRIREYFLCAACQVWLFREHFSASIASTTISAQRASLRSATSMVYVSVQFQSSLAICATVHQFQGFEKDVIMQFSTVNPICLFTKRICSRQTKAFTLQAPA